MGSEKDQLFGFFNFTAADNLIDELEIIPIKNVRDSFVYSK